MADLEGLGSWPTGPGYCHPRAGPCELTIVLWRESEPGGALED